MLRSIRAQPLVDGRDEDGRLVADRELVVSRGDGAVPLEAVDPALDRVTLAEVDWVELWWSAVPAVVDHEVYHGALRQLVHAANPTQAGR